VTASLAGLDATSNLNSSSVQQEFFGKRGLSSIWVRDDGKAATSKYFCGWGAGGGGIDGNSALVNLGKDAIISV
jgi:hypothetical protein